MRSLGPARGLVAAVLIASAALAGCSVDSPDTAMRAAPTVASPSARPTDVFATPTPEPTARIDFDALAEAIGLETRVRIDGHLVPERGLDLGSGGGGDAATLRIYTHGAYRVDGVEDVKYIFEPNGDVLQIRVGNIFAGASHYLTWNIGPDGYAEVLGGTRELEALVSRLEPDRSALAPAVGDGGRHLVWRSSDGTRVHELLGLDVDEQFLTAEQQQVRTAARALLAELDGLRRPQGKTRTRPIEWVPPHVTIEVRAEYDTRYYNTANFPWPFEDSLALVRDLADGDELTLCLVGADAELAWGLFMVDDVNHVRLPIEVDGPDGSVLLREAGLTIAYPLYNPSGSACPDVASINPPG